MMLTSEKEARMYWLDNLRTFLVFLVVLIHAAVVYEKNGMGSLWWIVSDPSTSDVPGLLFILLNIFVIATLFFIGGYFAPVSLKHKSRGAFLKSKFKRLMIPWMITVLTLIPLYKVIFLYSRNIPQENWATYFHWNALWSQNWLWFLPVLFWFNILYSGLSGLRFNTSRVSLKLAVGAVLILSFLYSFCMDIFNLHGWTKTVWINFQNERLLIYFFMFLLGSHCCKCRVFESTGHHKKLDLVLHSTGWIPLYLCVFLLIYALVKPGSPLVSDLVDTLMLRLSFTLSLVYLVYTMITTFRRYLNKQNAVLTILNANSYGVYIIHVIVLGGVALLLLGTGMPSLLKFLVATVSTFGVSHLIVYGYRQLTTLPLNHHVEAHSIKTTPTAILLAMSLFLVGCAKQDAADGNDPDQRRNPPRVSLHVAALHGNVDAIVQHIHASSDLNKKDAYGSTPLTVAITFGKTDVARALIEGGVDLNMTNNEGSTPLHIAAFFCRTEIVQALLDKAANQSVTNRAGRTALETVEGPFEAVRGIYDGIEKGLKPLGLKLDYERIRTTRPKIADMLR